MGDINENDSLKKLIGLMEKIDSIGKATEGIDERLKKLESLQDKISKNEESIEKLDKKLANFSDERLNTLEAAIESLKEEVEILKTNPRVEQPISTATNSNDIKDKCKQIRGLLDEIETLSDVKSESPKKPTVVIKRKEIEQVEDSSKNNTTSKK